MLPFPFPITGLGRRRYAVLLAAAAALALGACGTDTTFAPGDEAASPDASVSAEALSAGATPAPATIGTSRMIFTSYRTGVSDVYTMKACCSDQANATNTIARLVLRQRTWKRDTR